MSKDEPVPMFLTIRLTAKERARLNQFCGPGARVKREPWIKEAIMAAVERAEGDDGK